MTGATTRDSRPVQDGEEAIGTFCEVVAEDIRMLATLHDREIDADLLHILKEQSFPAGLGFRLESREGQEAMAALSRLVARIPEEIGQEFVDELAADFADIYLNNTFSSAPLESVWIDEEGLTCQEPMFQVREWYKRYGLAVPDWRKRFDDHLVTQMQFISHVLEQGKPEEIGEIARFMDEHLLRWLPEFAERVAGRCTTAFYSALAYLTWIYFKELRGVMADITGEPVPSREEIDERMKPKAEPVEVPVAYMPGTAPSW